MKHTPHTLALLAMASCAAPSARVASPPPPPPPAAEGSATRGLLEPEAIRAVINTHLDEVSACHERGLARDRNAAGGVMIRFVIGTTGAVTSAQPTEGDYPLAEVRECIARAVAQWRFPAPAEGGTVTVNYPFNIEPGPESDQARGAR